MSHKNGKKHPPIPPWIKDPSPENWVRLTVAAHSYFRKSVSRIHQMRSDGTLEEAGFPLWFDGSIWYCRLPVPIPPRVLNSTN